MIEHDRRIIHSSEESNWRTPPKCYQKLRESFNFAMDLAADAESALTERYFGPGSNYAEDALAVDWSQWAPYGPMFLNPPYSKKQKMPIEPWVMKCWEESQKGCRIVSILPFSPQTDWYRRYVFGHATIDDRGGVQWMGHAAMEEWRLAHRISFLRPDGSPASNAGVNSVVVIWRPNPGFVGPWQPATRYWSYR